ncbi:MAG: class I SAM-dependent methyltransferase [Candidatus Omnitrophota bacterium]|jgi:2-polyprenyl-3-methyl-5-hydroxy-6-metoxy-1,4-benzoquinol methylase
MLAQKQYPPCVICGCQDARFLFKAKGVDILGDKLFGLIQCPGCSLIRLYPAAEKVDFRDIDKGGFYTDKRGKGMIFTAFIFLMSIFMRLRAGKIEKKARKGAILDVGCGQGSFLKEMARRGWDCWGADISAYALDAAGTKENIRFCPGDVADLDLPGNYFDAVTFWHSFEHIAAPGRALNKARSILKDNGRLFISVPNVRSFEARMSLKDWLGLELPRHHYMYSARNLIRLIDGNGFRVTDISYNSLEYNFPFISQSLFNFLGGEHNLLHKMFKRDVLLYDTCFLRRLYTIFLIAGLLPLTLVLTIFISVVNMVCANGTVIEVFARKKGLND